MAPSAAAQKLEEPEKVNEEPLISEKLRKGIRGVLIGPPGSGKGTQVLKLFHYKGLKNIRTLNPKVLTRTQPLS